MRKEKASTVVQVIIGVTAAVNICSAALNLSTAVIRSTPSAPATAPATTQALCPATAAPQVIQYLNLAPPREHEKEPSRPVGQ
ncbi:MAG: hypothetical protein ACOY94_13110 [Bacillota bacterium]